jgi:hypothetical protein
LLIGSIQLGEQSCFISISSIPLQEPFFLLKGELKSLMTEENIPYGDIYTGYERSDTIFFKKRNWKN